MERVRAEQIVNSPTTANNIDELKEAIKVCVNQDDLYGKKTRAIIASKAIIDAFIKISPNIKNYHLSSLFISLFINEIDSNHEKNILKVIESLSNHLYLYKNDKELFNIVILAERVLNEK